MFYVTYEWVMSRMNASCHIKLWYDIWYDMKAVTFGLQHTATHCNALQRTATHCNALQHTATLCRYSIESLRVMSHQTPWRLWHLVCTEWVMSRTGWRRVIGCLKSQVIFRKRTTNCRSLLRNWPTNIRHLMHFRRPISKSRVTRLVASCCSELQCVAVCCCVLLCVAVCGSVLQCGAMCCSVLQHDTRLVASHHI